MSVDVKTFFNEVASNIATTIGSTVGMGGKVYKFVLPESPSECVAVLPLGGILIGDNPVGAIETQILVRAETVEAGLPLTQSIFDSLSRKVNILSTFKAFSDPINPFTGNYFRDAQNKCVFSLNFRWTLVW